MCCYRLQTTHITTLRNLAHHTRGILCYWGQVIACAFTAIHKTTNNLTIRKNNQTLCLLQSDVLTRASLYWQDRTSACQFVSQIVTRSWIVRACEEDAQLQQWHCLFLQRHTSQSWLHVRYASLHVFLLRVCCEALLSSRVIWQVSFPSLANSVILTVTKQKSQYTCSIHCLLPARPHLQAIMQEIWIWIPGPNYRSLFLGTRHHVVMLE